MNGQLREKDLLIKDQENGLKGWQTTVDELREQKINAEKYSSKLEEKLCEQLKELDHLTKVCLSTKLVIPRYRDRLKIFESTIFIAKTER